MLRNNMLAWCCRKLRLIECLIVGLREQKVCGKVLVLFACNVSLYDQFIGEAEGF